MNENEISKEILKMDMNLCNRIDYSTAKLLEHRVYSDYHYAAGHVVCTWDNYLGEKTYEEGEFIYDGEFIHGPCYNAPTYAEVIDWLWNEHNIIIHFDPCFTYSLACRVAFYCKVYKVTDNEFEELFDDTKWMSTFNLAFNTIINRLFDEKIIE